VDFEFVKKFDELLPLEAIKADPVLTEMMVCQRGTRLSITPVDPLHFKRACKLAAKA
jgi:predicted RNA-binding protein with PUA-like domain